MHGNTKKETIILSDNTNRIRRSYFARRIFTYLADFFKTHEWTSFIDALFTSTSAVCVTGLIVFDTATHWTIFGQIVILLLIQIGGMGIVTIAVSLAVISGKKSGCSAAKQ